MSTSPGQRQDVTLLSVFGRTPQIHDSAFVAPGCRIIGDVEIGPDVSIWYNCVLRADIHRIVVGARSNIQDGTVIHVDGPAPDNPEGCPTLIGEDVLIGHMAMIHGCVLEDRAFVGLGSIVMDGCRIESEAMLAAGALLTQNKRIPARQMWTGRPAAYRRDLRDDELAMARLGIQHYVENGRAHGAALAAAAGHGTPEG